MARYAVIGAGAAGLSAARTLQGSAHQVVVFEARDRPGGRAFTDYSLAPHGVELGAEFIHGERVSTWDWIREFDAPTTGEAHRYEMWFHLDGSLVDTRTARQHFGADFLFALEQLRSRWQRSGRPETTLDRVLELWPELSAEPLTAEKKQLLWNYMAIMTASDIDRLGTHRDDGAVTPDLGLQNFRLLDGYSRLMQRAASTLPIRYETPVQRIRWDDRSVELTANGVAERFDAAVVAVPLGVLQRGGLEFDPPLPAEKLDAIQRINAGHISKIVLKFDRVYWPTGVTFLWTPLSTQLWWRPGQGQVEEAPIITAFLGGSSAAGLESASTAEATEEATRQLSDILGEQLAGHVVDSRYLAWGAEEHTWMGYSSLPPGGNDLRARLAAPVGPLHFAGEAASATHPSTVDGAVDSGHQAANEILRSAGAGAPFGSRGEAPAN